MPDYTRIGDAERDEAISLLQEHHAAGRLSVAELEDRVGKALAAKVAPDLTALFSDLPGRKPGQAEPAPATYGAPVNPASSVEPWAAPEPNKNLKYLWAGLAGLVVLLVIMGAVGTNVSGGIPLVLILIVLARRNSRMKQERRSLTTALPRPLTQAGHQAVMYYLSIGDEQQAGNLFMQLTGADVPTAQRAIAALRRELGR